MAHSQKNYRKLEQYRLNLKVVAARCNCPNVMTVENPSISLNRKVFLNDVGHAGTVAHCCGHLYSEHQKTLRLHTHAPHIKNTISIFNSVKQKQSYTAVPPTLHLENFLITPIFSFT